MRIVIQLWSDISWEKTYAILKAVQMVLMPFMEPTRGSKGVLIAELDPEER